MKILKFLRSLFKPSPKRLEIRFIPYHTADKLIRESAAWRIAKEEDTNHQLGMVYLERVEIK